MALKATPKLVKEINVGDFISVRNVLKNTRELMRITHIRRTGTRYALNYADAHTGQEVDYLALHETDLVLILTSED
jgi:hypothetical protein